MNAADPYGTVPVLQMVYHEYAIEYLQTVRHQDCKVVFEIPSGYFADILGRRRTLLVGAVLGTLGFLIYSTTSGFYFFLAAEFVLGVGQSFISGADSALLYDTLEYYGQTHQYIKQEGRYYTVGNFSEAIAGVIGGAVATISLRFPFVLQTATLTMAWTYQLFLFFWAMAARTLTNVYE